MIENIAACRLVYDTSENEEENYEVQFNVVMGDQVETEFDAEIKSALEDIDNKMFDYEQQL